MQFVSFIFRLSVDLEEKTQQQQPKCVHLHAVSLTYLTARVDKFGHSSITAKKLFQTSNPYDWIFK